MKPRGSGILLATPATDAVPLSVGILVLVVVITRFRLRLWLAID
jgi:hypothetical protein